MSAVAAEVVEEVREALLAAPRALPVGGGTKPALSRSEDREAVGVETGTLRGITAYDPGDLTFTALAGTPLAEIEAELGAHGQWLPFDPPLRRDGATLGGAVAAGVPGSGAFAAGVVRDFVIGVSLLDGQGRLVSGGGRVVKNAAGFDLPKLIVGSAGRLGLIIELSCKVFPRPPATATVSFEAASIAEALRLTSALAGGPLALAALDLEPPGRVLARLAGSEELLAERVARLRGRFAGPSERLDGAAEAALWEGVAECQWAPAGAALLAAPTTAAEVAALDPELEAAGAERRYSLGAGLAWIAWPAARPPAALSELLAGRGLVAISLTGAPPPRPLLGAAPGNAFAARVRAALDPDRRFLELWT